MDSQGTGKPTWLVWKHHIFSPRKWVAIICFLWNIYLGREMECMHNDNLFNIHDTPQPLYNTIVWVQAHFLVSYPIRVISRLKCKGYIERWVLNGHLGSNPDPSYIQNRVITNRVIKRFRCTERHIVCLRHIICNMSWQVFWSPVRSACLWLGSDTAL